MRIGALINLITIEQQYDTGTRDSLQNKIFGWQTFTQAYAQAESRRGNEFFDSSSKERYSETLWIFTCHMADVEGVNAMMRIRFDDKTFNIKTCRPDLQFHDAAVLEAVEQNSSI